MAGAKHDKPGLLEKRREKKRLKQERTGDTREKKGERGASDYSASDMANRVARGSIMGGGGGGFGAGGGGL